MNCQHLVIEQEIEIKNLEEQNQTLAKTLESKYKTISAFKSLTQDLDFDLRQSKFRSKSKISFNEIINSRLGAGFSNLNNL